MKIQKSHRQQAKIKMGIQGPSGSGKTYSSLLLAKGLVGAWEKIVVIDTENGSSNLYSDLGPFNVLKLEAPYSPEKYMEGIKICVKEGLECIIIDSISHCWEFLLNYHSNLPGNSFANWSKVTPRYQALVNHILASGAHIVATMRTKQDYVLNLKDGKYVPEKVGLKAIQRDGFDYELTVVLDIDNKHNCTASKDRTGLFKNSSEFRISPEVGERIREWIIGGVKEEKAARADKADKANDVLRSAILSCSSIDLLQQLYYANKPVTEEIKRLIILQRGILQAKNMSSNGQEQNS